jgi:electron transfer flavoprotein beta subunit
VRIVVLVKQVPDTWSPKRLRSEDFLLDRAAADGVINELDTYAVEEALRVKERLGEGSVVAMTMGPPASAEAVRKALQMGADEGVCIVDDVLAGSDAVVTSAVLAAAIRRAGFDLVITGAESTDARMGVLAAMLAEQLAVPQATLAAELAVEDGRVRIRRVTGDVESDVVAETPAVVSVLEKINEPRYPSFKGIMAAKTKPLVTWTAAELGFSADAVGLAGSPTEVVAMEERSTERARILVTDDGDAAARLVEFLASRQLV